MNKNNKTSKEFKKIATSSMLDYQNVDNGNGVDNSRVSVGSRKFSVPVAICFTVNYVMGTGFLTMPYAFAHTGILIGLICLLVIGICAVISKDYVLETMARAEIKSQGGLESPALQKLRKERFKGLTDSSQNFTDLSRGRAASADFDLNENESQTERLIESNSNNNTYTSITTDNYSSVISIEDQKIEIPSLCELYLGDTGRFLYCFFLGLYIYGTLWVYTSVFASTAEAVIPIFDNEYDFYIYVGVFALIVVPLTCLELTEQIHVQVIMSICRFLMVFLMVVTTLAATWGSKQSDEIFGTPKNENVGNTFYSSNGWKNLYLLIPIVTYAYIYHHSLPGLSHPVEEKAKLGFIFNVTFLLCGLFYAILAATLAAYFGSEMQKQSNLNWIHYEGTDNIYLRWMISKFILLFPALDVVSAAPLNGITLGNNLFAAFYKSEKSMTEKSKVLAFRLLASIPPILGALIARDISKITDFTGIAGIIITFIFPSLLQWYSRTALKQELETNSGKTIYATFLTKKRFIPIVGLFGLSLALYSFIGIIKENLTSN